MLRETPDGSTAVGLKDCKIPPTDPGSPLLPAKEFSIRVPEGEEIVNWTVESGEAELLAENVLPVFAPRPHKTGGVDEDKYVPATRNEALYGLNTPYPAKRADLQHSGKMRGVTIATFRVSPVWFVGAEKKLYLTPSVTVKIFTAAPPKATVANPVGGAVAVPRSQLFEDMINAQVVNPTDSGTRQAKAVSRSGSGCDYLVITKEAFLAPARKLSEFRKAFDGVTSEVVTMEYIKDHYSGSDDAAKLRACIKSYVQTKGTEYVVLAGDDRVVPIREVYVKTSSYDYYDDAPSDLYYSDLDGTWNANGNDDYGERSGDELDLYPDVIVGRLPMRTPAQLATYVDKVIRYEETTTDDSDIVRKVLWFGYTLWDTLVHFEKITVGDKSVNDAWCSVNMDYQSDGHGGYVKGTTNATVVASRLDYQRPTEQHCDGLMEFLDRPFGSEGNDAEFWCRRLHEMFFRTNANWRTSFAFGSATSWDQEKLGDYQLYGDVSSAHGNTMQDVLNQGCHFAGLDTHGNWAYVGLGGACTWSNLDGYTSSYYAEKAVQLTNRVDIFCTEACVTGGFDLDGNASCPAVRNADNAEKPNFAEGFLRAPNGGSVVFVGCAREGYSYQMQESMSMASGWQDPNHFSAYYYWTDYMPEYSKDFVRGFWREVVDNRANTKIGPAFAASKAEWAGSCSDSYYHWLQLLMNLLGDPLLTVHTPPTRTEEGPRDLSEHSLVTLLRDPSLELTSSSAKIHVAADGIILGETAEVKLEYSTASNFSGAKSVTVASNVKNLGEFSKTLTGLSAGTKYYVRGKMTVTPKSGSAKTCTSPFSMSFTTLSANSVGGRIAQGGAGLQGITVTAKNADGTTAGTATTDADGQYSIALSSGWTGMVEPTMPVGKGAFPGSRPVTIPAGGSATADFEVKTVVYVNCRATNGKKDGSSWTDAFTSLADAFTVSSPGTVIWVAEGVYAPANLYGRDSHFAPADGVQVYGGFAGGETSLAQRDWIAHPTVLSGDIGTKGDTADNCYHVIRWASGVLLDGVGITGGRMDIAHSSSSNDNGAAIGNPASNPCSEAENCYTSDILTNGYHMVLDHCAVTNNFGHNPKASGNTNRYGTLLARSYLIRNTLIADNDMDSYDDGLVKQSYLDNCTITGNKNHGAMAKDCIIRNTIIYGNTKTLSDSNESKTTYGSTYGTGQKFMVWAYVYSSSTNNSFGSARFLTESLYCYYASSCPFDWYRGTAGKNTPDWASVDGFQYALTNGSYAAEKGLPLDWMDASSLDYLGNPRVQGTYPDLGCCEAFSSDTPIDPPPAVPPTGTVASSDVSYTTAKVTATLTDKGGEAANSDVTITLVVSKNSNYSSPVFNQTVTSGTAKSLTGLTANTKYYVKATFAGKTSGSSDATATFTTSAYSAPTCDQPPTVGSVTADGVTVTVSNVAWGNGSSGGEVKVEILSGSTVVATQTGDKAGAFAFTGLAGNTQYKVRVTLTGSNGLKLVDETQTFTTADPNMPVFTVSVSDVACSSATVAIAVSTLGQGGATSATPTVRLSKNADLSGAVSIVGSAITGSSGTVALTDLDAGTFYYLAVDLKNNLNKTSTSEVVGFQTDFAYHTLPGLRQGIYGCTEKVVPDLTVRTASLEGKMHSNGTSKHAVDRTLGLLMAKSSAQSADANSAPLVSDAVSTNSWKWANTTTYLYEGQIYLEAGTTYYFYSKFDDGGAVFIDDRLIFSQENVSGYDSWNSNKACTFGKLGVGVYVCAATGWHEFRGYVWDWTGGKKIMAGVAAVQYTTDPSAIDSSTLGASLTNAVQSTISSTSLWHEIYDDGTGSFLRILTDPITAVPPTGTVASSDVSYTTAKVTATLADKGDEATSGDVTITLVVSKNSDYSSPVFNQTVTSGTAKSLTGLTANTKYYVKATFAGKTSGSSDATTTFTTSAYSAPTISSVAVSGETTSGAKVSVTIGNWGNGSSGGTVKVEAVLNSTVKASANGTASGDYTLSGLDADTTYTARVIATGSNGLSTTNTTKTIKTAPVPFVTLSTATATVNAEGTSATLAVTVEDTNVSGGALALTLNGVQVKSWTLAKGAFSQDVTVTPGSTNTFSFVASGEDVTETANGSFVAKVYVGWFDVQFGDSGFVAGTDWIANSTDKSGGKFTATEGTETELVKGAVNSVSVNGEIVYTPSHASETDADVKLEGSVQVAIRKTEPTVTGAKAAFYFASATKARVYGAGGWTDLAGTFTSGAWIDYVFEFDYSSESAPRVRYTIGTATSDWIAITAATRNVQGVRFNDGTFSDFAAGYYSLTGEEPIVLERPQFVTDGSALAFGGAAGSETFSMTIANPVKGAYYTVFTSTTLEGTFTAEKASVLCDSSAATYTLTVDANTPAKFAKIVISTTPFAAGAPLPEK